MILKRHGWVGLLCLLPLLVHAAPAYGASTAASPGDPPAGSPSGAIYQLPFEKGRSDAAPKGSGGTGAPGEVPPGGGEGGGGEPAGGNGAAEGSFYRSENNFGSSSKVPGASADPSGGAGQSGSGGGTTTGGATGTGSAAAGGETSSESGTLGTARAASHITDSGNTSSAANILLLVAIGLIAIGVAVVGARANKLKSQRPSRPAS